MRDTYDYNDKLKTIRGKYATTDFTEVSTLKALDKEN